MTDLIIHLKELALLSVGADPHLKLGPKPNEKEKTVPLTESKYIRGGRKPIPSTARPDVKPVPLKEKEKKHGPPEADR